MDSVKTFVDEAQAFVRRNEDALGRDTAASSFGGLTWGFMRAIAECPNCPGVFRTPCGSANGFESDFDLLVCPACKGAWQHVPGK